MSKPRERELAEESAPLDEFVDRHHAEGSYDSTGQFTICQEKAERKLGKFQLEDDEDWILLLAQAANRSGATMMHVHLGLRTVDVTLKGPWKWEWARLRSAMKEKPTSDRALVSLAAAIRVLCTMYSFTVSPPKGEPQKWDHKSFTAVPKQGAAEETRISLHCGDWYTGLRLVNSPEFSHRRELLRKSLVSRLEPLASPAGGPGIKVCSQAGTLGAATLGFVGTALGARFFPPALWFTVPLGLYWAARSHQRAKTLAGELESTLSKELKTLPERVDSALHNDVWSPTKWIHHASIRDKDYDFL